MKSYETEDFECKPGEKVEGESLLVRQVEEREPTDSEIMFSVCVCVCHPQRHRQCHQGAAGHGQYGLQEVPVSE